MAAQQFRNDIKDQGGEKVHNALKATPEGDFEEVKKVQASLDFELVDQRVLNEDEKEMDRETAIRRMQPPPTKSEKVVSFFKNLFSRR